MSVSIETHVAKKRVRSRAIVLTRVDGRTALGKRIAELTAIYSCACGSADTALSPIKRLKVEEAAQLKALAERARGDYLRNGEGSLDDVVRIERKASAAERALGIVDKSAYDAGPTLADYLEATAEAKSS